MHYYVDGYNLLFKNAWEHTATNLQEARSRLIQELDRHASTLHITLTIVFDAPFQSDELKRGHFRSIEIIFTSKGQSADHYLIEHLQHRRSKTKVIVVTSDKPLARSVKSLGAAVVSVHDFLKSLRKRSQNKLAKSKNPIQPPKVPPATPQKTLEPLQDEEQLLSMEQLSGVTPLQNMDKLVWQPSQANVAHQTKPKKASKKQPHSEKKLQTAEKSKLPDLADLTAWEKIFEGLFKRPTE